tara:strand:- start:4292 stop:5074 length:783 start_codon:yes stop_codon:yes gene_type:complete
MKKSILITGANGYVARALQKGLSAYDLTTIQRTDFDLTDQKATEDFFKNKFFDVVIHTAIRGGRRLQQDDNEVFDGNVQMFLNLLKNKNSFGRFINLGSGAEVKETSTPYGFSKSVISNRLLSEPNFHNVRIYGIFDANELSTRFIKANITNYLNKQPMKVLQNKKMDFFYMPDLIKLIDFLVAGKKPLKVIECCYDEAFSLSWIANFINTLGSHKVDIKLASSDTDADYVGSNSAENLPIEFTGLIKGIRETFNILKNE